MKSELAGPHWLADALSRHMYIYTYAYICDVEYLIFRLMCRFIYARMYAGIGHRGCLEMLMF